MQGWQRTPSQRGVGLRQRQSSQGVREEERGRAHETGVKKSHIEQHQGLGAYWDADKIPGHFYRQTTYFCPHIAWED